MTGQASRRLSAEGDAAQLWMAVGMWRAAQGYHVSRGAKTNWKSRFYIFITFSMLATNFFKRLVTGQVKPNLRT